MYSFSVETFYSDSKYFVYTVDVNTNFLHVLKLLFYKILSNCNIVFTAWQQNITSSKLKIFEIYLKGQKIIS